MDIPSHWRIIDGGDRKKKPRKITKKEVKRFVGKKGHSSSEQLQKLTGKIITMLVKNTYCAHEGIIVIRQIQNALIDVLINEGAHDAH